MSNHCAFKSHPVRRGTPGFTLIELLVAVTIIGILASIVLGALASARITARRAKTKATITKLHNVVMGKYESYRTRRLPISTTGMHPSIAAQWRLDAIRDLMRMEMPERWSDVNDDSDDDPSFVYLRPSIYPPAGRKISQPSLSQSFERRFRRARLAILARTPAPTPAEAKELLDRYASAECLYMIVTTGDSDARAQFHDSEVGDVDGDGLPEFVDAWGHPILFLRWAPAFIGSDIQPNVAAYNPSPPPDVVMVEAMMADAAVSDHDPFDPFKVDMDPDPSDTDYVPRGWRLVPLIYSAGPDGIYDIRTEKPNVADADYQYRGSPYIVNPMVTPQENWTIGMPEDRDNVLLAPTGSGNGSLDHYDNIHNHRLGG